MKRSSALLVPLALGFSLFTTATPCRADAMRDLAELRAGKMPRTWDWLGWDAAGGANFKTLACSDGGTTTCNADLTRVTRDGHDTSTSLLSVNEIYCGGGACTALDNGVGWKYVVAERNALAALPARNITPPAPNPTNALGIVAGAPTRLELRAIDVGTADDPAIRVIVALSGKGAASETLATIDSRTQRLESGSVAAVYPSADGTTAALVVLSETGMMCWDFQSLSIIGVDLHRHRASLANTIGFHAWRHGDMTAAAAAFNEATATDPTFGLGWYNRAAIESRANDVASAGASFDRAVGIDSHFATRACKDQDFAALRAASPDRFSCR